MSLLLFLSSYFFPLFSFLILKVPSPLGWGLLFQHNIIRIPKTIIVGGDYFFTILQAFQNLIISGVLFAYSYISLYCLIAIRIYYKDPLSARTLEKASLGQQKRIIGFPQLQFYIITLTG